MATKLAIHIPPEANPETLVRFIELSEAVDTEFTTVGDMLDAAAERDPNFSPRTEIGFFASSMGLIEKDDISYAITSLGRVLVNMREKVRGELLHLMVYAAWHESSPEDFLPSWAYRTICDELWAAGDVELTGSYLDLEVARIINHAEAFFSQTLDKEFDGISFSQKSFRGARKWLEALQPPVIEDGKFSRRSFCSPELLLLAIGFVMRDEPDAIGVDILLSHSRREEICRVCLLDPAAFDQTLNWMTPVFPKVIASSEEAGYYGRYIRLLKRPELEDVVR